jgi:hypothetical protein
VGNIDESKRRHSIAAVNYVGLRSYLTSMYQVIDVFGLSHSITRKPMKITQ